MANDFVYRLRHKPSGEYFTQAQTTGSKPFIQFDKEGKKIFTSLEEIQKLQVRMDTLQRSVEIHSKKTDSVLKSIKRNRIIRSVSNDSSALSAAKTILEAYAELEVVPFKLDICSEDENIRLVSEAQRAIRQASADNVFTICMSNNRSIASKTYKVNELVECFYAWEKLPGRKRYTHMVCIERVFNNALEIKEFIKRLGLTAKSFDKLNKPRVLVLDMQSIRILQLSEPESVSEIFELSQIQILREQILKEFDLL